MNNNYMADIKALQDMYPDVYKRLAPHIQRVVESYNGEALDESAIDNMTAKAVSGSGVVPAMSRGYNGNVISGFAKTMLLSSLFGRFGYPAYPYPIYPEYPVYPVGEPFFRPRAPFGHSRRGRR